MASVYYNVTIYTGDIENAGTDSDVSVKLYFKSGAVLSKSDLDKKDHDDFERGTNDTYTIEANDDYGEIRYVVVSMDNSGKNASWYLEGVTVERDRYNRNRLMHNPEEWYFPAMCWLGGDGSAPRSVTLYPGARQVHYEYIGNYPSDRKNGLNAEAQGVCHDENNWFFTQDGNLWRIPIGVDLDDDLDGDSNKKSRGIIVNNSKDHRGDIDHYGGYIFVPVSNTKPARIEAYRAKDLRLTAIAQMTKSDGKTTFSDCGWCAINPKSGYLYTTDGDTKEPLPAPSKEKRLYIYVYKIDMTALSQGKNDFLIYNSRMVLCDNAGSSAKDLNFSWMQGGCFDNENHLHVSTGEDDDSENCGISVYTVAQYPEKGKTEFVRRITRSNQSHDFRYQFDGTGDEPEGITYWDLPLYGNAPNITGQLHAIMLKNRGSAKYGTDYLDKWYFKHFKRV